jgi:hypothetical protein
LEAKQLQERMKSGVFEAVFITYPTPASPLMGRGVSLSPTHLPFVLKKKSVDINY